MWIKFVSPIWCIEATDFIIRNSTSVSKMAVTQGQVGGGSGSAPVLFLTADKTVVLGYKITRCCLSFSASELVLFNCIYSPSVHTHLQSPHGLVPVCSDHHLEALFREFIRPMIYATALADMSLLTPTESNAFQSFLSSVDVDSYSDSFMTQEWSVYGDVSETPGKETLIKATKDLMSLDAVKWDNPPRSDGPSLIQNGITSPPTQHLFSYKQQQSRRQKSSNGSPRPQPSSIAIAPHRTVSASSPPHADDVPSASSSPASIPMSVSPPTPYEYYPPPPASLANSKRQSQDDTHDSSNKRSRPSYASSSNSVPAPKPALLSPSQKKANHIQSEQKRRANIRKGYEALCETIPALREAILSEEAACGSGIGINSINNGNGKRKSRRKSMNEDSGKIDGRAGPRSENVVLQKSSYI